MEHAGKIVRIEASRLQVQIAASSACAGCQAGSRCSSAERREKIIDVFSDEKGFRTGDLVWVSCDRPSGFPAVVIAYLLPLFLMMAGLVVFTLWLFPGREGLSALLSIALVALYYVGLVPFRRTLGQKWTFSVRPRTLTEQPETEKCTSL